MIGEGFEEILEGGAVDYGMWMIIMKEVNG